jgi:protein involved in polysaccharide export with SLBB domain
MRVSDLVFAAGGLKPGAGPDVEFARGRTEDRPQTIMLQLFGDPGEYTIEPDLMLSDDDTVSIQGRGEFKERADLVELRGRVVKPGAYAIKAGSADTPYTVWDLLEEGGGLLEDANPEGIVIYRQHGAAFGKAQSEDLTRVLQSVNQGTGETPLQIDETAQQAAMNAQVSQSLGSVLSSPGAVSIVMPPRPVNQRDWVSAIPVDGAELMDSKGKRGNLELHPLDSVVVPRRVNTVTVLGAVPRSGAVPYDEAFTCREYVTESGGFREDAAEDRLVVIHVNGSAAPITVESDIRPGDIIVVPTKHIVRSVRTESEWQRWFKSIVSLATAALIF